MTAKKAIIKFLLKKAVIPLVTLLILSSVLNAQDRKAGLQQEKKHIEEEIAYTNKLLGQTQKNRRSTMDELAVLQQKIRQRESLIYTIKAEVILLNHEIKETSDSIFSLRVELKKLKEEYAKMINRAIFPGTQGGPLEHIIAAKAVALKLAMQPDFVEYQKQILKNAKVLANSLSNRGYRLVSGGTDNHLLSIDLTSKNITGRDAERLLDSVGITTNKEAIPFDPLPHTKTSGLRLGTPALTTRGMKEKEMEIVAELIDKTIVNRNNEGELEKVRKDVKELTNKFPLYQGISYIK